MTEFSPIGIFDSGLGGLTVAKRVLERLPGESIAYFADQAHVPYGEKPVEMIRGYALGITDFLVRRGSKLVVMACNMSSATALPAALEMMAPVPVIGVIEAGARSAAESSDGSPIGVLATTGTVGTRAYTRALHRLLPDVQVYEQACPKFVPIVEAGLCDTPEAESAVREYAEPLISAGCRTIILGCTHYPFLIEAIERIVGPEARIVDPAVETAAEAADILFAAGLLARETGGPEHAYFTSGCPDQFRELGGGFLGRRIEDVRRADWGLDLREVEGQGKMVGQTINSAR